MGWEPPNIRNKGNNSRLEMNSSLCFIVPYNNEYNENIVFAHFFLFWIFKKPELFLCFKKAVTCIRNYLKHMVQNSGYCCIRKIKTTLQHRKPLYLT